MFTKTSLLVEQNFGVRDFHTDSAVLITVNNIGAQRSQQQFAGDIDSSKVGAIRFNNFTYGSTFFS